MGEFVVHTSRNQDRGDSRHALDPNEPPPLPGAVPTEKQARDLDYQTPRRVLDLVDSYFGGQIHLDPASCEGNPTNARMFMLPARGSDGRIRTRVLPGCKKPAPLGVDFGMPPEQRTDGLSLPWSGNGVFVNPPYGAVLETWLAKIAAEVYRCRYILALLPASRFEMGYFHDHVLSRANAMCCIRKRLAFLRPTTGLPAKGNPYSSILFQFAGPALRESAQRFCKHFESLGCCIEIKRHA